MCEQRPLTFTKTFFPRSNLPLNNDFGQDASFYQCTMRHLWDFGIESSSVARIFWRFAQNLSVDDGYWKNLLNWTRIHYGGLEKVTSQTAKTGYGEFQLVNFRGGTSATLELIYQHFDDPIFLCKAGLILSQVHNTKGKSFFLSLLGFIGDVGIIDSQSSQVKH